MRPAGTYTNRRAGSPQDIELFEVALLGHAGRLRISYRELREQLSLRPALPLVPVTADDVNEVRTLG